MLLAETLKMNETSFVSRGISHFQMTLPLAHRRPWARVAVLLAYLRLIP